jgi:hypothetical protein
MLDSQVDKYLTITKPAERPAAYKDCFENFYEAKYPTTNEEVRDKNLATDKWYSNKKHYNFATGKEAHGKPKFMSDFATGMLW